MCSLKRQPNPLMALTDIRAISDVCRPRKIDLVVDNTFMSPYFSSPSRWVPTWSCIPPPSSLNGHSDGLGGVVVCTRPEQADKLHFCKGRWRDPCRRLMLLICGREDSRRPHGEARREWTRSRRFLARHKKVKKFSTLACSNIRSTI